MMMKIKECMLTTLDNPFDPFDQYEDWYAYDSRMGYHTPSFLARLVVTSSELSPADTAFAIEMAIDDIIKYDPLDMYKKVSRETIEV